MKRLVTPLLGAALLLCCAATAFAVDTYPPGPAYRSCPDTLTIFSIQRTDTLISPCSPAVLDLVNGIGGIVIGFDAKPTGFAFYMQNNQSVPGWGGIDVFTGSTNYNSAPFNLALGDSVVVYGRTQEFPATNGESEIEGPDGIQGTNDIIIRKVSAGNPLPPIQVLTTTQMNWIPTAPGAQGERYEGMLVRVRGPLRVARITPVAGLFTGSFLCVTTTGIQDSIMVEGQTLTTIAAPALGTIIDSLQGIVNQRTTSGINSYRIQLRDGNDMFLSVPPNLVDAYPIEDNTLRLEFDRNVDVPTATNAANYSLASGIDGSTVDAAIVEGGSGRFVRLTITSVRVDGDVETVSAVNIGSAGCPTCLLTPPQGRTFVNGVLAISTIQAPDPARLADPDDRSRFAGPGTGFGTKLTFRGVCTAVYGALYYMQDEAGGLRSGVSVFAPVAPLVPGQKYRITGQIQEFGQETEVVNTVLITNEGAGTIPAPVIQTVATLDDTTTDQTQSILTGEDYECMLVKLYYVRVTENRLLGQSWFVAGPAGSYVDTMLVSNLNGVLDAYLPPDSLETIEATGILHQANGTFRVCPRNAGDIVKHGLNVGVPETGSNQLAFAVSPNPARIARLSFTLPERADVEIGVFDLQGRKVADVAKGSFAAGAYAREWNARDASGKQVGAGVYFYRLKVNSEVINVRGVILN